MGVRANTGLSGLRLTSLVLWSIGGAFLALTLMLRLNLYGEDTAALTGIFGGAGLGLLAFGALLMYLAGKQRSRGEKLVEGGKFVLGQVIDMVPDYSLTVPGGHPLRFTVRYLDAQGEEHLFRSEPQRTERDPQFMGRQVKVYIKDDSLKRYYVDVAPLLENTAEQ